MWRSFFTEKKWLLWSWGGFAFIILSLLAQTYIDVKINEWYKGFYDLLQKAPERELSEFYDGEYSGSTIEYRPKNYINGSRYRSTTPRTIPRAISIIMVYVLPKKQKGE